MLEFWRERQCHVILIKEFFSAIHDLHHKKLYIQNLKLSRTHYTNICEKLYVKADISNVQFYSTPKTIKNQH